jgi:acetyl-CoA acetyltransferase
MTLDDYLASRMIADPLRLYDCVLPCAGAEAVIVGKLADAPNGKGIKVLAGYEHHNHPVGEPAPLRGGWELYRDALWRDAGYAPTDMDFVQAYDDYPIMVAIQLEDLGFCCKGEVGTFLEQHDFSWAGSLPLNTGGGQLSCGQSGAGGGMIGLTEAVRQLRQEAGDRQVRGARRGLVSGYGMVGYGHGLSTSAMVLECAA